MSVPSSAGEGQRLTHGAAAAAPAEVAREAFERARAGQASLRRLDVSQRTAHLEPLRRVILSRREEIVARIHEETRKTQIGRAHV